MKVIFYLEAFEAVGVHSLMSVLEKEDHDCRVLFDPSLDNYYHLRLPFLKKLNLKIIDKQIEEVKQFDPDVFCFSISTPQLAKSVDVMRRLKIQGLEGKLFIAGGVHPSAKPEQVLNLGFDYACVGDGEVALPSLLSSLESDESRTVKGIWKQKEGEIGANGVSSRIENLNLLPNYKRDELFRHKSFDREVVNYMTGRGCPFECNFCFNSFYNDLYDGKEIIRRKKPAKVIDDLKRLDADKSRLVFFHDDIFLYDQEWLREFSYLYAKEIATPFFCSARLENVDEETVKLIKDYCSFIHIGIESGSPRLRSEIMGREYSNDDIKDKLRILQEHEVKVKNSYMFGFPTETRSDILETIELAKELKSQIVSTYIFTPYPNTKIYEMLRKEGRINKDSYRGFHSSGERFKGQKHKRAYFLANLFPLAIKLDSRTLLDSLKRNMDDPSQLKLRISKLCYLIYMFIFMRSVFKVRLKTFLKRVVFGIIYLLTDEERIDY